MNLGKRVMVMGSPGSGKSTIAKRISEITGLPAIHIDRLSWNPGWIPTPPDILKEKIQEAADQPSWVIDGNYSATRDYRLHRADTVIFLDFSRYTCLLRALLRWIKNYGRTRYDLGEGCPEKSTWRSSNGYGGYPKRSRGHTLAWLGAIAPPKQVFHLKGNRSVKRFLQALESSY